SLAGSRDAAQDLLPRLAAGGFLEWAPDAVGEGVQLLDRATDVRRLPVDWRGLDARRERELRKLQKMQGYVYTEGCRRGYVLRYFGDPEAMDECGACDTCLGLAQPSGEGGREARERAPRARRSAAPAPPAAAPASPADALLFE